MALPRISIRKMGTRAGQPHYGVTCIGCPATYGRDNILRIGHCSKDGADIVKRAHLATDHGRMGDERIEAANAAHARVYG